MPGDLVWIKGPTKQAAHPERVRAPPVLSPFPQTRRSGERVSFGVFETQKVTLNSELLNRGLFILLGVVEH